MLCFLFKGGIRAGFFGALSLALLGFTSISGQDPARPKDSFQPDEAGLPPVSKRGPGMKGPGTDFLKLPVPRTFDLTHVEPEHFAAALGKDPQRIFDFVRDHVAFEVYSGCLRGPRGTLLAMAGNSVDRATLLASLLEKSGYKVRFVCGTLPKEQARELVLSMWAERPQPAFARVDSEITPAEKTAGEILETRIKRDYLLILDHLKRADKLPARLPAPNLGDLIKQAQEHCWVQWQNADTWIDFDPSFIDSAVGKTYAKATESYTRLPEQGFHQVEFKVRVEEYPLLYEGDAPTKPQSRVVLTYRAKAADLSGIDLILAHQPDKWKGPATSLNAAMASAIETTGSIKPILILGGRQLIDGIPFRERLSANKGIGGIGNLLGGKGTRNSIAIATAEAIECDLISPSGRRETVVREVFDLIGKARRGDAKPLGSAEVRQRIEQKSKPNKNNSVYSFFFTTGGVQATHLLDAVEDSDAAKVLDVRTQLRRLHVTFAAISDSLLDRVGHTDRALVRFYLSSPRFTILELSGKTNGARLSIDLRQDHAHAVALGTFPDDIFLARLLRGIAEGTLERVLIEVVTSSARQKSAPVFSTSSLFDRVNNEAVLLSSEKAVPAGDLPADTRARVCEEMRHGLLALAPRKPLTFGNEPRYAWWRIDPRTGETTAVTDEGLHQTAVEFHYVRKQGDKEVTIVRLEYVDGQLVGHEGRTFQAGSQALGRTLRYIMINGGNLFFRNVPIPISG